MGRLKGGREGLRGVEGCALGLGTVRTVGWLIDKDGMCNTPERWRCGDDVGQNQRGAWKSWGVYVSAGAVPPECRQSYAESSGTPAGAEARNGYEQILI